MSSSPREPNTNKDFNYNLKRDEIISLIDTLQSLGGEYEDAEPIRDYLDHLTSGRNQKHGRNPLRCQSLSFIQHASRFRNYANSGNA